MAEGNSHTKLNKAVVAPSMTKGQKGVRDQGNYKYNTLNMKASRLHSVADTELLKLDRI